MQARRRAARKLRLATGLSLALLWAHGASAGTFPVFGPEDFVRTEASSHVLRSFAVAAPGATTYTLHIDNGGLNGQHARVTSAVVKLNGTVVVPASAFDEAVATIDRPVTLTAGNELDIDLRGKPGSGFRLVILGLDDAAPTLAITAPNQSPILGDDTPTVSVAYSDALSGIDTATLKIAIDGTLLAGCTVGPASATCEPPPLANGSHTVTSEIKDKAGNLATASFPFDLDLAPVVQILSPAEGSLIPIATPGIAATYVDATSGIDTASVRLLLDGVDRTAEAQVESSSVLLQPASPLPEGAHTLVVRVRDTAGNQAEATAHFTTDTLPPALSFVEPSAPVLPDVTTTPIRISYSDAGSGVDLAASSVEIDGTDLSPSCSFAAASAVCTSPTLTAGAHSLLARVRDLAGNPAVANLSFEIVLDGQEPSLSIAAPAETLITGDATPAIRVEYADPRSGVDLASLRVLVDEIDLTSGCQVGPSSATCEPPVLARGPHTVSAQVADQRGNLATASFAFALTFPLEVAFTEPEPDLLTGLPAVRVAGTVSPQAVSVKVNGIAAQLGSGAFTIESLGLHDGVNDLVAVAEDAGGNFGSATVRVVADTTPPVVSLTFPADGATVATPTITVAGLVNDLTIGTVSDTQATVTVNGVSATVENRSFVAAGVPLQPGLNILTAVAEDRAGNQATSEILVTLEDRTGIASIRGVSGDGQSGLVSTELPQPLVVRVTDAAGLPVSAAQVVFRVDQGNGVFAGERIAVVPTNAQGEASIRLTLGTRAGVGADRVRATAVGIAGEVSFVASAMTGQPAAIHVASGDNQRGAVGGELSRPLFAVVTDDGDNPVAGVPVTFRVTEGGGGFVESGGADTATAETDESGLASVHLTLGPAPGFDSNLVEATFAGLASLPAVFKQSSFLPGDPAETRISGVVLDNQGDPVPGVTMRLRESVLTTVTDAEGKFLLTGVPVGQVFLIADATTATRPGSWASLEFELFNLPGVDNAMPRPIYILPLDLPNGVYVDETRGGTVTVPDVPGVSLEIAPGTVTFPGGSRSGVVSVTAVKADKVPMPPGAGMQPRLIVTIQPAGAHFDPPAPFTLPNVDGLAPGTVTELFSFDHDIGEFVSIGTGTVSQDGLVVRSDPGFGIVEAGWHCGAPPSGRGSSAPLKIDVTPEELFLLADQPTPDKATLSAHGEPPLDAVYTWAIGSTSTATLNPSGGGLCANSTQCDTEATAAAAGEATATATILCTTSNQTAQDTAKVYVVKVDDVNVHSSDPQTAKVPSVLGSGPNTKLHFVTARNQGDVVLTATITPDTQAVRDKITWEASGVSITSPAVGSDKRTARFSSNMSTGIKIPITIKIDGKVALEIVAWVVSADMAGSVTPPSAVGPRPRTGPPRDVVTGVAVEMNATATIRPQEIIMDGDRPNLSGPNTTAPPPPGGLTPCNTSLAAGATRKWDIARRAVVRASTVPAGLPLHCVDTAQNYPADPLIGNDDDRVTDESNAPYAFPVGRLTHFDQPARPGPNLGGVTVGNVGNTYRSQLWFEEFARLELTVAGGPRWFLISDPLRWRVDYRMRKVPLTELFWGQDLNGDGDRADTVTETMFGRDANGDGDQADIVGYWEDNGSTSANDNAGRP